MYDKDEIKNQLDIDDIFQLVTEFGGEPEYSDFGFISRTICHNPAHEGSRKLYYYENSGLFQCWTGCGGFDIFELIQKVASIQWHRECDLNEAIRYVAYKFGLDAGFEVDEEVLNEEDWKILEKYNRIQNLEKKNYHVTLKPYDPIILSRFNYNVKLTPWLKEGITQESLTKYNIGFYPGGDQITIPHYDVNGNFIGLRGRTLCAEDAKNFGKYRPINVNNTLYNHPLGMNLYGLNQTKENIAQMQTAIVFEGEKSVLLYQSYFPEANISVATCGSNISMYQIQLLIDVGAKNVVIAFDRQFKEIGDDEWKHWTSNLQKIYNKYNNYVNISFIFDKNKITNYKDSPIDRGAEIFLKLFNERVVL